MNLRDEIINIIEDHLQGSEVGIDGQEEATDEILKLVEKRIDLFIEESKKRQGQRRKDPDTNKFYDGWFAAMEYFKQRSKQ